MSPGTTGYFSAPVVANISDSRFVAAWEGDPETDLDPDIYGVLLDDPPALGIEVGGALAAAILLFASGAMWRRSRSGKRRT